MISFLKKPEKPKKPTLGWVCYVGFFVGFLGCFFLGWVFFCGNPALIMFQSWKAHHKKLLHSIGHTELELCYFSEQFKRTNIVTFLGVLLNFIYYRYVIWAKKYPTDKCCPYKIDPCFSLQSANFDCFCLIQFYCKSLL